MQLQCLYFWGHNFLRLWATANVQYWHSGGPIATHAFSLPLASAVDDDAEPLGSGVDELALLLLVTNDAGLARFWATSSMLSTVMGVTTSFRPPIRRYQRDFKPNHRLTTYAKSAGQRNQFEMISPLLLTPALHGGPEHVKYRQKVKWQKLCLCTSSLVAAQDL